MRVARGAGTLALVTLFSVLPLSPALCQTGTVRRVLKGDQAKINWESDDAMPASGSMGLVVDGDHNLALFRVLASEGRTSTVQVLDSIWPAVVMSGEGATILKETPVPTPSGRASFFVWSGHTGRPVSVDHNPAGNTPLQILLAPGSHEILVELPTGGKSGALVEARAGDSEVLLLSGKIPGARNGMGPAYLNRYRERRGESSSQPRHLLWLEDNQGTRIYLPCEPLTPPVIKTKVNPRYPEFDRINRVEGRVWLYALLGADGRPIRVEPIAGPSPSLSREAVATVSQWVYQPATLHGRAVPSLVSVAVDFILIR